MGKIIKNDWQVKLLMCLGLLIFSILFMGAGRVTQKLSDRKNSKKSEITRWENILKDMSSEIPKEHKAEWLKILNEDPDLLMSVISQK